MILDQIGKLSPRTYKEAAELVHFVSSNAIPVAPPVSVSSSGGGGDDGSDDDEPEDKGKGKATADDEKSDSEDDPFADESAAVSPRLKDSNVSWQPVPTVRKIVSGKYEAK